MTPRKNLIHLRKSAFKKINKLSNKALYALTLPNDQREYIISYVVIESLNTWNNFLRAFYLSLIIESKSVNGKKITITTVVPNFNDAIGLAISTVKGRGVPLIWQRRDEPAWHDINNFLASCRALSCSYYVDIQNALSIGSRVYTDLPVVRNYYAHRNDSTALKVKNIASYYSIPSTLLPTEILCSYPLAISRPLIVSFLDDLYISIEFLCEGL